MHFIQSICVGCNPSAKYSDWWYCTNPANFREFTIGRNGAASVPEWCPHKAKHKRKDIKCPE